MITSMTGFGKGASGAKKDQVFVEVKVLNSRFMEIKIKGPDLDPETEWRIRERVQRELLRGSALVMVNTDQNNSSGAELHFDRARFEALEKILITIQKEYGRHIELSEVISSVDLFSARNGLEVTQAGIMESLESALHQVVEMRRSEGRQLQEDLERRLDLVTESVASLEAVCLENTGTRKERLREKLQEFQQDLELDETRLAQEVAFLVERSDITEEITRCRSHIEQFRKLMEAQEPVGKRLNFLLQEIGREINTIGSKGCLGNIVYQVIEIKDQIEKMREQIQNVL